MHVLASVAIWTNVCADLKIGGDLKAIWTYECACFSACGHTDLRLCMFERRRRYGLTLLHIAAPAVIWTYVYAYASVAGELENTDVAVARDSYAFGRRGCRKHCEGFSDARSTCFVERMRFGGYLGIRSAQNVLVFSNKNWASPQCDPTPTPHRA